MASHLMIQIIMMMIISIFFTKHFMSFTAKLNWSIKNWSSYTPFKVAVFPGPTPDQGVC